MLHCPGAQGSCSRHPLGGPAGTYVQNDQGRRAHERGAAEGEDEAHSAPHAEADEDERDEDQLRIGHGGGGAGLRLARLADGPVLRQCLVLWGQSAT